MGRVHRCLRLLSGGDQGERQYSQWWQQESISVLVRFAEGHCCGMAGKSASEEADGGGRRRFIYLFYFQDWLGSGRHLVVQGCVQAWCERADMADSARG